MNIGDKTIIGLVTAAVNGLWAILLSLLVELVPAFAKKWGPLLPEQKKSIRGWAGLVLSVATMAFLHFAELFTLDLSTVPAILLTVFSVLAGWTSFVLSGETTYQTVYSLLPRKRQ